MNILPWLQDTATDRVWASWGIAYRDVLILDAFNRPVGKDNLTGHDLGVKANYDNLKKMLLNAAIPSDSDRDGLPDDWERFWFDSLAPLPTGDEDNDGFNNGVEFAFSTNPKDSSVFPRLQPFIARPSGKPALATTFRRFAGGTVDFVVETSPDLSNWTANPTQILLSGSPKPLYDGMAGVEVRFQQTAAAGALRAGFTRVRPVLKLAPP